MTPRRSNSAGPNSARSPATRWRAHGLRWRSSVVSALTIGAHEPRSTLRSTAAASTPLASTALAAPDLQPLRQDRRLVERSSSPSPSGSSGIWAAWRRRPDPFGRGLASQPTLSPAGATTNQVDQDHPRLVLAAVTWRHRWVRRSRRGRQRRRVPLPEPLPPHAAASTPATARISCQVEAERGPSTAAAPAGRRLRPAPVARRHPAHPAD